MVLTLAAAQFSVYAGAEAAAESTAQTDAQQAEKQWRDIHIESAEDLKELAANCVLDSWSEDVRVILEDDIDLTGSGFTSIPCFAGLFEGQGHTIRGISITKSCSHAGLFRYLTKDALVKDLTVDGRLMPGKDSICIGGIAGRNEGMISGCSFTGSISCQENAGGIAGENAETGIISDCTFSGTIIGAHAVGGIAGKNDGKILSSRNDGKVNVTSEVPIEKKKVSLTGDLASSLENYDIASLSSDDFMDVMDVGGIAGISQGLIDNCTGAGTVGYPHIGYNIGGIVGRTMGYVSCCTNEGEVFGRKDTGGIAGQLEPQTVWDYSSERLENLLDQLKNLDSLLTIMVSDASVGIGAARDHMTVAEQRTAETVSALEDLLGKTSDELVTDAGTIKNLVTLLSDSIRDEDAAGIRDCLTQLNTLLNQTGLTSPALTIRVNGNMKSDTVSAMTAGSNGLQGTIADLSAQISEAARGNRTAGQNDPQTVIYMSAEDGDTVQTGPGEASGDGDTALTGPGEDSGDGSDETEPSPDADTPEFVVDNDDELIIGDDFSSDNTPSGSTADTSSDVFAADDESGELLEGDEYDTVILEGPHADAEPETMEMHEGVIEAAGEDGTEQPASPQGEGAQGGSVDLSLDGSTDSNVNGDLTVQAALSDPTSVDQIISLIEQLLGHGSALLDTDSLTMAKAILGQLSFDAPDAQPFYTSLGSMLTSLEPLDNDIADTASTFSADFAAVMDQVNTIYDTVFEYLDTMSLKEPGDETAETLTDPWQSNEGAVSGCVNRGNVNADQSVGGIVGAVEYEDLIDAEDMVDVSQYILKDARKMIFAAVRSCENKGDVSAKKSAAGGITGSQKFGVITGCISSGKIEVTEGDLCGGIAGTAQGGITLCRSENLLIGSSHVGGIAGKAENLSSCISSSQISSSGEYIGAVAGEAAGTVQNNYYLDRGLGGVDSVSFHGCTDPFSAEENPPVTAEAQPAGQTQAEASEQPAGQTQAEASEQPAGQAQAAASEQLDGSDSQPVVTFMVGDEIIKQVPVPFGGSIDTLPEVENDGEDYWVWDEFDQSAVFSDITVNGSYHHPIRTLSAGGNPPQFLAEGTFYEGMEFTAVPGDSGTDDSGTGDSGAETYTVAVSGYDGPLTIRMKAQDGGTLKELKEDGSSTDISYTKDGSYLVFPMTNGGTLLYEPPREGLPITGIRPSRRVYAAAGGGAVLLLTCIALLIRKKRRHK